MTKIFEPEITPGPWIEKYRYKLIGKDGQIVIGFCLDEPCFNCGDCENNDPPVGEDFQAIAAIPEYIEIVKALRHFIREKTLTVRGGKIVCDIEDLRHVAEALTRLDTMHGVEQ